MSVFICVNLLVSFIRVFALVALVGVRFSEQNAIQVSLSEDEADNGSESKNASSGKEEEASCAAGQSPIQGMSSEENGGHLKRSVTRLHFNTSFKSTFNFGDGISIESTVSCE